MELVINFAATGEAEAMHLDTFDLAYLGSKSVQRASEIVFNEDTQRWDLHVPQAGAERTPVSTWGTHPSVSGFGTYEAARQLEVAWFNRCRAAAVHPLSEEGLKLVDQAVEHCFFADI